MFVLGDDELKISLTYQGNLVLRDFLITLQQIDEK